MVDAYIVERPVEHRPDCAEIRVRPDHQLLVVGVVEGIGEIDVGGNYNAIDIQTDLIIAVIHHTGDVMPLTIIGSGRDERRPAPVVDGAVTHHELPRLSLCIEADEEVAHHPHLALGDDALVGERVGGADPGGHRERVAAEERL